jgi:hypothetical protein
MRQNGQRCQPLAGSAKGYGRWQKRPKNEKSEDLTGLRFLFSALDGRD